MLSCIMVSLSFLPSYYNFKNWGVFVKAKETAKKAAAAATAQTTLHASQDAD